MTKGERIKQRREELNMRPTELAKRAKISKQTLYKYERDIITNIPSDKLQRIADALDIEPSYLMGWKAEAHFATLQQSAEETRAKELYSLYENATPEVQSAVELLLRSSQQTPEVH